MDLYVLYCPTTNMSYIYAWVKLSTPDSRVTSILHCQVHQATAPAVHGKSHGAQKCFSSRVDQGCCRVAVRGMGSSCSAVAIPVAFLCLLLHWRLTASQRWKPSQIMILEALKSGKNAEHSPFWEDGRQVYPGTPLHSAGVHTQCPA